MVKFAKGIPEAYENEANMDIAYDFVENTKLITVVASTTNDLPKTDVKNG